MHRVWAVILTREIVTKPQGRRRAAVRNHGTTIPALRHDCGREGTRGPTSPYRASMSPSGMITQGNVSYFDDHGGRLSRGRKADTAEGERCASCGGFEIASFEYCGIDNANNHTPMCRKYASSGGRWCLNALFVSFLTDKMQFSTAFCPQGDGLLPHFCKGRFCRFEKN